MEELIATATTALFGALATSSVEVTAQRIAEWFGKVTVTDPTALSSDKVIAVAEKVLGEQRTPFLDAEMTKKNLARWFEIPEEEYDSTPAEQKDPLVLIHHIHLESLFHSWLEEWGYTVSVGEELQGEEGVEYTADIYGTLDTLHGAFEIAVNLVCDKPPNTYRVLALLETIEAYAAKETKFGAGDLYIIATPFSFGRSILSSLALQRRQECYAVVKLEFEDLWDLQKARDKVTRRNELQGRIMHARREASS